MRRGGGQQSDDPAFGGDDDECGNREHRDREAVGAAAGRVKGVLGGERFGVGHDVAILQTRSAHRVCKVRISILGEYSLLR
ncbi:hypothetical protein WS62_18310 [Burkholderia sp. ABCPW 14]|nr:hypothetical protein WS62_18310 [Burkholderia sp. ABCPW 14]